MKLFIHTGKNRLGGPRSFITKFSLLLNKFRNDVQIVSEVEQADIVLALPFGKLSISKKVPIVGRVDGFYKYSLLPKNFLFSKQLNHVINLYLNRNVINIFNQSDALIFQSLHSKKIYESYGLKVNKPYRVIYNFSEVPKEISSNKTNFEFDKKIKIIVAHIFREGHRYWWYLPILNELKKRGYDPEIFICGSEAKRLPFNSIFSYIKIQAKKFDLENIVHFCGELNQSDLNSIRFNCHLMLTLTYDDYCPNSVIESLAAGKPVVGPSSGGVGELIAEAGTSIEEIDNYYAYSASFWKSDHPIIDVSAYADKIIEVMKNYEFYSVRSFNCFQQMFDPQKAIKEYSDFLHEINNL